MMRCVSLILGNSKAPEGFVWSKTREEVDADNIANWKKLAPEVRAGLLDHLFRDLLSFPGGRKTMLRWKAQQLKGERIGSDSECFHFGAGRHVRNILRQKLYDDKLPPVVYEHAGGAAYSNWDDYYVGALDQFVTELEIETVSRRATSRASS